MGLCDTASISYFQGKLLYHLACDMKTPDENAAVGERIRFYRMKGNTLADLIGISRYAIIDYGNNQTEPLLDDLKKTANTLDIEVDKLYDDYYRFLARPYSEKIKQIRMDNNLLQRELGEMFGVGRLAVERWEHGRNKVTRTVWEKLKSLNLLKCCFFSNFFFKTFIQSFNLIIVKI